MLVFPKIDGEPGQITKPGNYRQPEEHRIGNNGMTYRIIGRVRKMRLLRRCGLLRWKH